MKTFKLKSVPKIETGFKTPDSYFENFSIKIIEQLPKNESKVISIFQKRKSSIMMVAAILVLALMIPILSPSLNNTKELDAASLENYITYQSNVNQYDLISELETDDINKIKPSVISEHKAIEEHLSINSNLENLILE